MKPDTPYTHVHTEWVGPLIIDESRFQVIAQLGDATVVGQLIDMFFQDAPKHLEGARQAVTQSNTEDLRRVAHTLKGSSRTLGLSALGDSCERIEHASKRGDLASCSDEVDALPRILEQSRVAIYDRLATL